MFKGYTVDERLKEFRKVDFEKPDMEFIPFDSEKGKELLQQYLSLNPNCSEATFRMDLSNLTQSEIDKVGKAIEEIEREHTESSKDEENWWYDTWYGIEDLFGKQIMIIKGEVPYNCFDELEQALLKKLDKAQIIKETKEYNLNRNGNRIDLLTKKKRKITVTEEKVEPSLWQKMETDWSE